MTTTKLPTVWLRALTSWSADAHRTGLAPKTAANRRTALVKFAATHPRPFAVTAEAVAVWLDDPSAWAPTSPRTMGTALRTFYAWARNVGHVSANPVPSHGRVHGEVPPPWAEALAAWRTAETRAGRAPGTVAKHLKHVTLYATTCAPSDPGAVTPQALAEWFRAQPWEASTATTYRASLRAFYAWAHAAGYVATDPAVYLAAIADPTEPRPHGSRGPVPKLVPEAWREALRLFRRHMTAQGRSPETIRLRTHSLEALARALAPLGPWAVTFDDLVDYLAARTHLGLEARRNQRSALRVFYGWAMDVGHVEVDPARRLPPIRTAAPNPRPASEVAVRVAMLAATPRERLMIRLAAEAGLRAGEISRIHTRDLMQGNGGWSLRVHGKGSRERLVPLHPGLAAVLREAPKGWLFPSPTSPTGHLGVSDGVCKGGWV